MTYAALAVTQGKEAVTVVEIDLPSCSNTYGSAPCTASVGVTGSRKCYNFYRHCQDTANYTATTKTVRFSENTIPMPGFAVVSESTPADLRAAYFAYPMLESVKTHPVKVDLSGTLGRRGAVTITLRDAPDSDSGIDPYLSERTYDPLVKGTFWSKMLTRIPYLEGSELRVLRGYSTDPWDWANFQTEYYIIERVDLGDDGVVTVIAKDPLKLTDDDRAQAPAPNTGELLAGISAGATSATLTPTGIGATEYAASGKVRIGSEICSFTRSGDTLTLTRGQNGTTATTHDAGDTAQQCLEYTDTPAQDIIQDLLEDYAGLSASWIDKTAWDTFANVWFPSLRLSGLVSAPTGINTLLKEVMEVGGLLLWWDPPAQKVQLEALRPPRNGDAVTTLTEADNLIENSVTRKALRDRRLTRVQVWYERANEAEGVEEQENYKKLHLAINSAAENANAYGSPPRTRKVYTRWLQTGGDAIALALASRRNLLASETPYLVTFELDASDMLSVEIGDIVTVTVDQIVDDTGAPVPTALRILSVEEIDAGHRFRCEAELSGYTGRYGFIGPNTLNDYASESTANRANYGFISDASGLMSDGSEAYKII